MRPIRQRHRSRRVRRRFPRCRAHAPQAVSNSGLLATIIPGRYRTRIHLLRCGRRGIAPGSILVDAGASFTKFFSTSDIGGAFQMIAAFPVTGDTSQLASFEVGVTDLAGTAKSSRAPIR